MKIFFLELFKYLKCIMLLEIYIEMKKKSSKLKTTPHKSKEISNSKGIS
jgi:hypothetical protein